MKKFCAILLLSCSCLITGFGQRKMDLEKPLPFEWNNQSMQNWSFLKEVLQDKKIVALGESLHGVKEYSALKLELIQYLHEELGFNVLAMENDMVSTILTGWYRDRLSDTLLLKKSFSPVWHTKTNLELVNYLKRHPKLQIIGFDMQQPISINHFLQKEMDNQLPVAVKERADFQKMETYWTFLNQSYSEKDLMQKRDSLMAKNLIWLISNFYKNEKVIIWAANDHISKVKLNQISFMGDILTKEYGEQYYALGLFRSLGNPTHLYRDYFFENNHETLPHASLEYKFLKWKADNLFVDFKKLKRTKKTAWLKERVNQVIDRNKPMRTINLSESFDGIIWIKEVTHPEYVIESSWHYLKKE